MADVANRFSAAGPTLGYVAQVEYALLQTLQRMASSDQFAVSIETLDDIVFEDAEDATPLELFQSKHSYKGPAKNITDASEDLWKTLHNWFEADLPDVRYYLMTTSANNAGSIASRLCQDPGDRDVEGAEAALEAVADAAGNSAHSEYYAAYLARNQEARLDLLSRVFIMAEVPTVTKIEQSLLKSPTIRIAAPPHRRKSMVERLRAWWLDRALKSLYAVVAGHADPINVEEVHERIHYINNSIRDDNLPLDYDDLREPTLGEADADTRIFVEQLRLIAWHSERIRMAIYDHNRAFTQRSRWQREKLVDIDEMKRYDRRLTEEWKRHFLPTTDSVDPGSDNESLKAAARDKLLRLEQSTLPEVREALVSGYIPIGSMHMLADQMQIGWHPEWVERLRGSVNSASSPDPNAA